MSNWKSILDPSKICFYIEKCIFIILAGIWGHGLYYIKLFQFKDYTDSKAILLFKGSSIFGSFFYNSYVVVGIPIQISVDPRHKFMSPYFYAGCDMTIPIIGAMVSWWDLSTYDFGR